MLKFVLSADAKSSNTGSLYLEVTWPVVPRIGEQISAPGLDLTPVKAVYHNTVGERPYTEVYVVIDDNEYENLADYGWKDWARLRKKES